MGVLRRRVPGGPTAVGVVSAIGALLVSLLTVAPPTAAEPGPAPVDRPSSRAPDRSVAVAPARTRTEREVRRYWTPERMAAATPIEDVLPGLTVGATDDRGDTAGRRAATSARSPARLRKRAPRSTGKLFFRDGSHDYVCSAAAIRTKKRNQVLTAGHCVHTGPNPPPEGLLQPPRPRPFSDWVFVPRYRNGKAPFGRWVALKAHTFTGWIESESYRHDQAVITFKKRKKRRLVDVVGGSSVAWGKGPRQWGTTVWGWPAESPFTGEVARSCHGRATRFEGGADAAIRQCDLNGGASGGPWFLPKGRTKHTGRIWAVTSRRILNRPIVLARPLPPEIRRLLRAANR